MDINDVNTVLNGGQDDKTIPPRKSKYFDEIFFPSHMKHTDNSPNKDLKSVELT